LPVNLTSGFYAQKKQPIRGCCSLVETATVETSLLTETNIRGKECMQLDKMVYQHPHSETQTRISNLMLCKRLYVQLVYASHAVSKQFTCLTIVDKKIMMVSVTWKFAVTILEK
jgi:hypothetical protein